MERLPRRENPLEILLAEDSPGDVRLTLEAFKEASVKVRINVVPNGEDALAFLRGTGKYEGAVRPDLLLLDLNMPRKDGRQVLAEVKQDPALRAIPVVVLTTSNADEDVFRCYDLCANCYVTKPFDVRQFHQVVRSIEDFWFRVAALPRRA